MWGSQIKAVPSNPVLTVSYKLDSGNIGNTFSLNASTGQLSLLSALDYETQSSFALQISASAKWWFGSSESN